MSDAIHPRSQATTPPVTAARASRRAGRLRPVLWACLVLVLLLGGWLAYTGYTVARHGQSLLRVARQLQAMAQEGSPSTGGNPAALIARTPELAALVDTAATDLRAIHAGTVPLHPLLRSLGWMPGFGGELAATPHLLGAAVAGAEAAQQSVQALQRAPTALQAGGLAALYTALREAQPELLAAEAALRPAQRGFRIATLEQPLAQRAVAQADAALPPLLAGVRAALVLPELMGDEEPQTYLILGQNNDELRATGGFIGTAGLLTIHRGEITNFEYRDSYQFDPAEPGPAIEPPRPFREVMGILDWRFRDANWWADFPTTARYLEGFLRRDQARTVHGVVALDQTALQQLMERLGPVDVPAFGEQVNAANLLDLLERYAHPTGYKEGYVAPEPPKVVGADRKAFLGELARILMARVQKLDPAQAAPLLLTMRSLLDEKHLLIALHHPEAAALLRERNWDGALPPVAGDTLLVAETNVGYSKANRFIQQGVDYQVTLLEDLSVGQSILTLTYRNTNSNKARHCDAAVIDFFTADDSCYKSYVRVYVPPGSVLLGMSGFNGSPEWLSEGNRTVFANLLVLQPGETRQVTVRYIPPRGVVERTDHGARYRLRAIKQPGTGAVPFTVAVTPPPGMQPTNAGGAAQAARQETDLRRDRDLTVEFQRIS